MRFYFPSDSPFLHSDPRTSQIFRGDDAGDRWAAGHAHARASDAPPLSTWTRQKAQQQREEGGAVWNGCSAFTHQHRARQAVYSWEREDFNHQRGSGNLQPLHSGTFAPLNQFHAGWESGWVCVRHARFTHSYFHFTFSGLLLNWSLVITELNLLILH